MDLRSLGWTYNGNSVLVDRIEKDHHVPSSICPTNPAFVTVNITNISNDKTTGLANFSSVLTLNLLELDKQDIQNITCGDLLYKNTLHLNYRNYFYLNVSVSYISGILSRIELHLTNLVSYGLLQLLLFLQPLYMQELACTEHNTFYKINFTGYELLSENIDARNCVNKSCSLVFTKFSANFDNRVIVVATNHSHILRTFQTNIGEQ